MYIPKKESDQLDLCEDVIRRCMTTQAERINQFDLWRKYFLSGSDRTLSVYNKIYAHIDTVSAFIYSPGSLRLYVDMPSLAGPAGTAMAEMGDRMSRELNSQWHGDNHDALATNLTTWSLVYGTMFEKTLWTRKPGGEGIVAYSLSPHQIGVMDESIDSLSEQEAIVHEFYYNKDQLWRTLKTLPRGEAMWNDINFMPTAEAIPTQSTLQTVITQAQGPVLSGVVS